MDVQATPQAASETDMTPEEEARERRMLIELRAERHLKLASSMRMKRERVPKVDYDANPFCESRQLADAYQLQNLNRVRGTNWGSHSCLLESAILLHKSECRLPIPQKLSQLLGSTFTC